MKHKKALMFSDYKIKAPGEELKDACLKKALSVSGSVGREKGLFAQMKTQISYIGFWFWGGLALIICLILGILLYIGDISPKTTQHLANLTILSIAGPFLAIISTPVLARSYSSNMWELEEASFFNLPRLTSLRMIICAVASLPPIAIFLFAARQSSGWLPCLFALLVPFFLSNSINYFILGRLRGMAGSLCCIGAGAVLCIVSMSFFASTNMVTALLAHPAAPFVMAALIAASALLFILNARLFSKRHSLN